MDHYIDVKIHPDDEMRENVLLNKVYTKLHKVLWSLRATDVGVSFPDYEVKLGRLLRIHGSKSRLQELQDRKWIGGLVGYCVDMAIKPVPVNGVSFRTVSRKPIETPEGLEFSGDVVVTTIDQVTNAILTHRNISSLVTFMDSHVVFDEFHEYINMAAFNLLFAELVKCKQLQGDDAKAILVSATPNYYFVEEFLEIDRDDIVQVASFNQSQYQIKFEPFDEDLEDDSNPLYQAQPAHTFVISNTAITAQKSFIDNQHRENGLLFHSKFKKSDKDTLFTTIYDNFKRDGSRTHDMLRSGPVVQASLNITCDQMITEFTHAENWLQRLGRLDRFGLNDEVNRYITAIPQSLVQGKQNGKCARFLNSLNSLQSAKKWYAFLEDQLTEKTVTLTQIYKRYQQFYDEEQNIEALKQDFLAALKESVGVITAKVLDPVWLPPKKKVKENVKIKKYSLRGDNRFVQMAVCQIDNRKTINFPDQYAYGENDFEANLTAPVEQICGYGDSKQNILAFMAKKHHNMKGGNKTYKDQVLLNEARSPETPIYLSYIPADLKQVESDPHAYAIYYAMGNNQPIGAISLTQLIQEKKENDKD